MASKRSNAATAPRGAATPYVNAALLAVAVSYGLWLLVIRGRVDWPPHDFLNSVYTVTGCLALVGPLVLLRRSAGEGGLGDLVWLSGGLLTWTFDLAALVRGEPVGPSWATPLATTPMGLTILAVLLAGWRTRGGGSDWTWTNVVGWLLGLFWVGMGLATLIPLRTLQAAAR